jgi:hypothetical protein
LKKVFRYEEFGLLKLGNPPKVTALRKGIPSEDTFGRIFTPSYDQVAAAIYDYKVLALAVGGTANLPLGNLKAKNIILLGKEFGLSQSQIQNSVQLLSDNRESAKEAIFSASIGNPKLKDAIINLIDARWKGTFAWIDQSLSKRDFE